MSRLDKASLRAEITSYYDAVSDIYDDLYQDGLSSAENAAVADLLHKYLPNSEAQVLDLGSGHGLGLTLGGWQHYTGIDISKEMNRRAALLHPEAKFLHSDMEHLEFEDASFDYVISLFGSISHCLSPENAVAEIERVLRPDGRMVIMAYSQFSIRNLYDSIFRRRGVSAISPLQEYQIRNLPDQQTNGVFAHFYTVRRLRRLFSSFEGIQVIGLSAFCEMGPIRRAIKTPAQAARALAWDQHFTRLFPNSGHSLILTAQKKGK